MSLAEAGEQERIGHWIRRRADRSPTDPYLRKMWKTFWGDDFDKLLPSNTRAVVPAAWRVEVSPAKPAKEDFFLHVMEIGDRGDTRAPRVELVDGSNLIGALVEGGTITLFATS